MDVWARIMVLFVIQINIIGASDVDRILRLYHGSVLVQAFSLNILQERLRGIMRRSVLSFQK